MKQKIYFKLFGGIRVSGEEGIWRSMADCQDSGIGKKQQAFLIYLILNRKDIILSETLKEKFWPCERKNPANSLKNMIHKTRALLNVIVPESDELLLTRSGGYEWNPDIDIECD
ncbi:MAG: winged helix-turn-helix domain-containing protein, partial [Lachnospiraceae bacterium]|nr:winged helix-turn-helix domain-containing protein [Lachnospiraceae bacterium]